MASRRRSGRDERGYTLLAVLWLTSGITALAFAVVATARGAMATSRNRAAATTAEWDAVDCLSTLRARVEETQREPEPSVDPWINLDLLLKTDPTLANRQCRYEAWPVGGRLSVNEASEADLNRLASSLGLPAARADSAVRQLIGERPFESRAALRRSIGQLSPGLDSLLDVETGALDLSHAPDPLLELLPGIGDAAVRAIHEERKRGWRIRSFNELAARLESEPRAALEAAIPLLVAAATPTPVAWVVTARTASGLPPVTVVSEWRLDRSVPSPRVTRAMRWIE